jgi:hypothetical protein
VQFVVQDGATLLHVVAGCKGAHEFSIDAYVDTARELLQHGFSLIAKDKVLMQLLLAQESTLIPC